MRLGAFLAPVLALRRKLRLDDGRRGDQQNAYSGNRGAMRRGCSGRAADACGDRGMQ